MDRYKAFAGRIVLRGPESVPIEDGEPVDQLRVPRGIVIGLLAASPFWITLALWVAR